MVDAVNCVWQVPDCDFSTYKTNAASGSSSSGSSSGWGGGGGGFSTCGNGNVTGSEECDDGNVVNGDGCSSICKIEEEPQLPPSVDSGSTDSDGVVSGNAVAEGRSDEDAGKIVEETSKTFALIIAGVLVIGGIAVTVYFMNRKRQLRGY